MTDPYAQRRAFQRLYDSLPTIECKRLCGHSCGPLAMSDFEFRRLENRTKKDFSPLHILDSNDRSCPALKDGGCTVYDIRPLICRLYGVAFGLECPHGCKPSKLLTREEARALIAKADEIGT